MIEGVGTDVWQWHMEVSAGPPWRPCPGILFWIDTQQHLHAGEQIGFVQPDLGVLRIEAEQDQFRIILAFEPRGDERVQRRRSLRDRANAQGPWMLAKIVAFRGEGGYGASILRKMVHQPLGLPMKNHIEPPSSVRSKRSTGASGRLPRRPRPA